MKFICPASMRPHAQKVFAGEYELPVDDPDGIVDVGANVGAFMLWAHARWPQAKIVGYEPDPNNWVMLVQNAADIGGLVNSAVCFAGKAPLFRGRDNCGEATLFPTPEHHQEPACEVDCISAQDLPACDVLKVDTEGAELPIFAGYPHLGTVRGVAYEWHSQSDRSAIARILKANGLRQLSDVQWAQERGVARWVR